MMLMVSVFVDLVQQEMNVKSACSTTTKLHKDAHVSLRLC